MTGGKIGRRLALISHAYIEPELRKGIGALANHVDVRVISPRAWHVLLFRRRELAMSCDFDRYFFPFKALRLFGGQYLLLSMDLGFRKFRPDVVLIEYEPWSIMFWQGVITRWLFAPRARIICSVKKNTYRRYRGWRGMIKEWLAGLGIRRVDHFIAASQMTRDLFVNSLEVPADRISVITHLAVDTDHFKPLERPAPRSGIVIGFCGRFDDWKGVEILVRAVERARERSDVDITLRMVGTGSLDEVLHSLERQRPWMSVEPAIPNVAVAVFMQSIDVFVMPPLVLEDQQEHDAHAILEALSSGTPCIGTISGIIPEILGDGFGVLAPAGNAEALADEILRMATDPDLRQALAQKGRIKAQAEFTLESVAAAKAAVIQGVLND